MKRLDAAIRYARHTPASWVYIAAGDETSLASWNFHASIFTYTSDATLATIILAFQVILKHFNAILLGADELIIIWWIEDGLMLIWFFFIFILMLFVYSIATSAAVLFLLPGIRLCVAAPPIMRISRFKFWCKSDWLRSWRWCVTN